MEKDRKDRYQSATQMKADLQQLKRETESGQVRSGLHSARLRVANKDLRPSGRPVAVLAFAGKPGNAATVLAAVGAYFWKHREVANAEQKNAIAVLPLQNMNGDISVDYLRFALAE